MDYLEQAQLIGINRSLEQQKAAIENAARDQELLLEELLKRQNSEAERRHEEILRVEAARGNVEAIRILEERNAERERARIQVEQFRAEREIAYREYLRQNELNEAQAKINKINKNRSYLYLSVIICFLLLGGIACALLIEPARPR